MSWLFLRWPGNAEVITDAIRGERGYFDMSRHGGGIAAALVDRVFTYVQDRGSHQRERACHWLSLTVIGCHRR